MTKRILDLTLAFTGFVVILPVILICCMLILVMDQQNPFFLQQRLGRMKRTFVIIKLRSMKNDRVTSVGRVMRLTGLDELPQLLNILKGDMSFIGPRPITPFDAERLNWNDDYHSQRWICRPGLTGLAQLSPSCHRKMSWFLDKKYTECACLTLDLKLMLASVVVLFVGKPKAIKWIYTVR
jgi:lipopolysaccharide/colanic/teichoic acid biosynthesis glycosyltransferase